LHHAGWVSEPVAFCSVATETSGSGVAGAERASHGSGYASSGWTGRVSERRQERNLVTVLFCDLVGYTQRSEAMDPEDVASLLEPYQSRVRDELVRTRQSRCL
jgi:class 3 adenylate cyclase